MSTDEFGRQGGSRPGFDLDLSSCVNPYGPPPSVLDAVRSMNAAAIAHHPYGASAYTTSSFARYLEVDTSTLVTGRGISGLLKQLQVAVGVDGCFAPPPAYTEFFRLFPKKRDSSQHAWTYTLPQLDRALRDHAVVLISNPSNPSGTILARTDLIDIARRHSSSLLVVDESYVDFRPEPAADSLVGAPCPNVLVFRSATKMFATAGLRIGVGWSRDSAIIEKLGADSGAWPVSMLEAVGTSAALEDRAWAQQSRSMLQNDSAWLDGWLERRGYKAVGNAVNFRLLADPERKLSQALEAQSIAVRELGSSHGLPGPAVRMSAPSAIRRSVLEAVPDERAAGAR